MKIDIDLTNTDVIAEKAQTYINDFLSTACLDLDNYMKTIDNDLRDAYSKEIPLSDELLETHILNIPSIIYYTLTASESYITKEAIAKLVEKDTLNSVKVNPDVKGTVAQKQAIAELSTQTDTLIHIVYSSTNKAINRRIDAANEMLNSLKKVMNRRVSELELSNSKYIHKQKE